MRIDPNLQAEICRISEKHPRPWAILGVAGDGSCAHATIVDRNWEIVLGSSEWLNIDHDVLTLIVKIMNDLPSEPGREARRKPFEGV